jgi:histidine triad (HIT) family protein
MKPQRIDSLLEIQYFLGSAASQGIISGLGISMQRSRKPIDLRKLHEASRSGLCFICESLKGNPEFHHEMLAETDAAVAFLNRYPTLFGSTFIAPKRHLTDVTGDFSKAEYLDLQAFTWRVSEALRKVLKPERNYILSLGSLSANAHVHWHIAPLPPGLPLEKQQYHALMHEHGAIEVSDQEREGFVKRVRAQLGK